MQRVVADIHQLTGRRKGSDVPCSCHCWQRCSHTSEDNQHNGQSQEYSSNLWKEDIPRCGPCGCTQWACGDVIVYIIRAVRRAHAFHAWSDRVTDYLCAWSWHPTTQSPVGTTPTILHARSEYHVHAHRFQTASHYSNRRFSKVCTVPTAVNPAFS